MNDLFAYGIIIITLALFFAQGFFPEKFFNNGIIFGIRVPKEYENLEEINSIIKEYKKKYLLFGGILYLIFIIGIIKIDRASVLFLGILTILGFNYYMYYNSWKAMKKVKEKCNFKALNKPVLVVDMNIKGKAKENIINLKHYLVYAVIIIFTIGLTLYKYSDLPQNLVVYFTNSLNEVHVVKGTLKGILGVFRFPLVQIGTAIMFMVLGYFSQKSKKILNSGTAKGTLEQQNIFKRKMILFLYIIGVEIEAMYLAMQFAFLYNYNLQLVSNTFGVIVTVTAVVFVVIFIIIGQGGKNIKVQSDGEEIYRDDDRFYKIGGFYVNSEDPAIMIQKRMGIGYDLNYGNPISIALVIITVIFLIITFYFMVTNDMSIIESFNF